MQEKLTEEEMKKDQKLLDLEILFIEAGMLVDSIDNSIKINEEVPGIDSINYLSNLLKEKFIAIEGMFKEESL